MNHIDGKKAKKQQKNIFNTRDAVESSIDLSKTDRKLTWIKVLKQQKNRILTWTSYQKEFCQNNRRTTGDR